MRTTEGKPVLAVRLQGERELAEAAAAALAAQAVPDRATHGFHTYPAGLHPDAARDLLALFPGVSVLDPFCGGGTVLVESMIAGRRAEGGDVGPVACMVAWARTRRTDEARRTALRSAARRITERARLATELPPAHIAERVDRWYERHVAVELESIRLQIPEASPDPVTRDLLWAAFSSILIKVSWRRSDTSPLLDVRERPPGTTSILFHKRVREYARQLEELEQITNAEVPEPVVRRVDARVSSGEGGFDLILTSPPYPAVYDYLPAQDLRKIWLGLDVDDTKEIGARRHWREDEGGAIRRWLKDTEAWMRSACSRLSAGGAAVVVIGDGLIRSGPIDALAATVDVGTRVGMKLVCSASLARPDHARASERWEHVVVLSPSESARRRAS